MKLFIFFLALLPCTIQAAGTATVTRTDTPTSTPTPTTTPTGTQISTPTNITYSIPGDGFGYVTVPLQSGIITNSYMDLAAIVGAFVFSLPQNMTITVTNLGSLAIFVGMEDTVNEAKGVKGNCNPGTPNVYPGFQIKARVYLNTVGTNGTLQCKFNLTGTASP